MRPSRILPRFAAALPLVAVLSGLWLATGAAAADDPVRFQPICHAQPLQADPRSFTASCEIGPFAGAHVSRVTVRRDGSTDTPTDATFLPFDLANRQAAILFLIDRSDRRRARTVAIEAGDALRMADVSRGIGPYRIGLASVLADRLDVVAPIGSGRDDLARAASQIRADGQGAENLRGVLDAIRLVAQTPADRHILVLATDGKPEDKALAGDEVIQAARNAGVTVIGIGYREHTGEGAELASLKRLAEESGGFYAEPLLPATRVEDSVVSRFGQFASSGGLATFPLDKADPRTRYQITVETDGGRPLVGTYVPEITLPGLKAAEVKPPAMPPIPAARPAPGPKPAANTPIAPVVQPKPLPQPEPREPGSLQDRIADLAAFGIDAWSARPLTFLGGALLLALIAAFAVARLLRRARRIRIFAWIEMLDQRRTRFPVTKPGVRLGRHSDNDIRFRDKSVHRYHAILQRDAATGRYQIADVSGNQARSNGVMVNGELVHQPVVLGNGDTIELGDVSFRFVYI